MAGRGGLEGNFKNQTLPSCIQLHPFYQGSVHNLLQQFIVERGSSNAKDVLAMPGITLLLENLESMMAKPRVGGAAKRKSRKPCAILRMHIG